MNGVRILAVCASVAIVAGFAAMIMSEKEIAEAEIGIAAQEVIDECASAREKSLCYERVIPRYMDDRFTMEQAFEITKEVQRLDPSFTYCHVLAHNISAKETAKDPSKWKDVVARASYGLCGNGGSHGAFQERYRDESMPNASVDEILRIISDVCEPRETWKATPAQIANCVHGVGHLAMYVTNGDVEKSNALCTAFAAQMPRNDYVRTCYEGVFMQVFQPIEPEDKALVEDIVPEPSEAQVYCNTFSGQVRAICIRESWILNPDPLVEPSKFEAHCAGIADGKERAYCYEGIIMGVYSRSFNFDETSMIGLCRQLRSELQSLCVETVAYRLIQTDWRNMERAVRVCAEAGSGNESKCFQKLQSYVDTMFAADDPMREKMCELMPKQYSAECIQL